METVNNLASSASRAIWGTSATETIQNQNAAEPIAGETGDVKAGEPYDKGNLDSTETETTATSTSTGLEEKKDTPTNLPIRSEHETDKTGITSHHNPPSSFAPSDKPTSSTPTGANADPSSAPQDTQKQQGADRPHEEPEQGSDEHERIKATKKEAEDAAKVDTSSPGPKSLDQKAASDKGTHGGEGNGLQKESHAEGTGEKYVKSSGMNADGGDFDASNAGAGKEADRLLEQKGVHHTPGIAEPKETKGDAKTETGKGKEGKEKVSLKDKIKAKLHKN